MGAPIGNLMMSNQYKGQAKVAHAQGRAQQTAAYKQAYNLEEEARSDSLLASTNMMRQRENQTATQASVRNAAAASGFTSQGSGQQAEIATADIFETAIRDMALSNAISDSNKRYAADVTRFQGNLAMQAAEDTAEQYSMLAKNAKTAGYLQAGGSLIGGIGGYVNGGITDAQAGYKSAYDLSQDALQFMPGVISNNKQRNNSSSGNAIFKLFSQLFPSQ